MFLLLKESDEAKKEKILVRFRRPGIRKQGFGKWIVVNGQKLDGHPGRTASHQF